MATKSILKTVKIRDSKLCRSFADAIEKTKYVKENEVQYSRECTELDKGSVKKFFENDVTLNCSNFLYVLLLTEFRSTSITLLAIE